MNVEKSSPQSLCVRTVARIIEFAPVCKSEEHLGNHIYTKMALAFSGRLVLCESSAANLLIIAFLSLYCNRPSLSDEVQSSAFSRGDAHIVHKIDAHIDYQVTLFHVLLWHFAYCTINKCHILRASHVQATCNP